MLYLWVHKRDSCGPGGVSDGSWLAVYQTLVIECPSSIFFWYVVCYCSFLFVVFVFASMLSLELVDVPLIFFCPASHVTDWQTRILLGMLRPDQLRLHYTRLFPDPRFLLFVLQNIAGYKNAVECLLQ